MAIIDSVGNDITALVKQMKSYAATMDEFGAKVYLTRVMNIGTGTRYDTSDPLPTMVEAAKHAGIHYRESGVVLRSENGKAELNYHRVYGFLVTDPGMTDQQFCQQIQKNAAAGFQVLDGGDVIGTSPIKIG